MYVIEGAQKNVRILASKRHFTSHLQRQFSLETSFLASVYVRNTELSPCNYAEDFRNVKMFILLNLMLKIHNVDRLSRGKHHLRDS